MRLTSTTGRAPEVGLRRAVREGLAPDGGLYQPTALPDVSGADLAAWRGLPFASVARHLAQRLLDGEFSPEAIDRVVGDALDFPVPVRPLGDGISLLELFHGPTLAFKDFGARFLARLFSEILAEDGDHATVLVATSGDTGSAVARGFAGVPAHEGRRALPRREGVAVPGSADGDDRRQRDRRARARRVRRLPAPREGGAARLRPRAAAAVVGELHQHRPPAAADVLLRDEPPRRGGGAIEPGGVRRCRRATSAT